MIRISTPDALVSQPRIRWPEWTILSLYTALVAFAIPWHEPWADEAQAWQLARSLSLTDLFRTYVRYEGSPGLWHLFLWVLIRLHVSYAGLHWICGAIAVAATALLVFESPFPRYIKFILPFTYFLVFQYAVVARSYVFVPILLFCVALCWKKNPLLLALLLGLLANVALHSTVISGGLAVVYLIEQIRSGSANNPSHRRQLLMGAGALVCFWAFAVWTAWPPHDLGFHPSSGPPVIVFLQRMLELFRPWGLPIPFWIAMAVCFRSRHALLYMLPVLLVGLFCLVEYASMWHVGLLYPLVISLLWITWPAPGSEVSRRESTGRTALVLLATLQIFWSAYALRFDHFNAYSPDLAAADFLRPIVQQGGKIAVTYFDDPINPVSSATGVLTYRSVGILPYFERNIFINQPDFFWSWSTRNPTAKNFYQALLSRPDVVVVEMRTPYPDSRIDPKDPKYQLLSKTGYAFTHMFCGARPVGLRMDERSCHLVFEYSGSARQPIANQADASTASR
jgi:hypothetical protein